MRERKIHDLRKKSDNAWIYKEKKLEDGLWRLNMHCVGLNLGDILMITRKMSFEVINIIEKRDHAGTFRDPQRSKDSFIICDVKQLPVDESIKIYEEEIQKLPVLEDPFKNY